MTSSSATAVASTGTTVIDPVCDMQIDRNSAAGSATYGSNEYYFCSAGCRAKFLAAPDKFVGAQRISRADTGTPDSKTASKPAKDVAKDPICGMMVDKATA